MEIHWSKHKNLIVLYIRVQFTSSFFLFFAFFSCFLRRKSSYAGRSSFCDTNTYTASSVIKDQRCPKMSKSSKSSINSLDMHKQNGFHRNRIHKHMHKLSWFHIKSFSCLEAKMPVWYKTASSLKSTYPSGLF